MDYFLKFLICINFYSCTLKDDSSIKGDKIEITQTIKEDCRKVESFGFFKNRQVNCELKILKINDSLTNIYVFTSRDLRTSVGLIFLKNNKCMSWVETRSDSIFNLGDIVDLNNAKKCIIKKVDYSIIEIGSLKFERVLDGKLDDKQLNIPIIHQDNYYYSILRENIKYKIKFYQNPINSSKFKNISLSKIYNEPFLISTGYYYYNENEKYYLIGFDLAQTKSVDYKKKYFIKEKDLKYFNRER